MPQPLISGPLVLTILDGWGIAPASPSNPITNTDLPNFAKLEKESLRSRLWAHGEYVGLPKDQDGNSEAGHLNLGAGRIVKQDSIIISDSVRDGTFFKNPAFHEAIAHVKRNQSQMHVVGMLSNGQSAHSTPEHLYALLDLLDREKVAPVWIHLFTDGRDSSPNDGRKLLAQLSQELRPNQKIASITGRFYGMDRKKSWDRTEAAYNAIVLGQGACYEDPAKVFADCYRQGIGDEFIPPSVSCQNGAPLAQVKDNDSIIFFNHRSDRARQLAKPFVQANFASANPGSFTPARAIKNLRFVAMTDFGPDLGDILTAYPSVVIEDTLPLALAKKTQLYLAETEKYAHATYFFNGGYANPVNGEDRLVLPSPNVDKYDATPGMATAALAETVCLDIKNKKHEFIAFNIACLDMVGHTGNFTAAQEALRAVDRALGEICAVLAPVNGTLIVTADHGNIEEMKDLSANMANTEHSKNQVNFWLWSLAVKLPPLRGEGILADVGPTVLELYGINQPQSMTGKSLFKK